jgi:hypothetical protein
MSSGMLTVHCQFPKLRNVKQVLYLAELPEPRESNLHCELRVARGRV